MTLILCPATNDFGDIQLGRDEITRLDSPDLITSDHAKRFERVVVTCKVDAWGEKDWTVVRGTLRKKGKLYVRKSAGQDFFKLFHLLREHFIPYSETTNYHILALLNTVTPDIVSPDVVADLMQRAQPLNHLFNRKDLAICGVLDPRFTRQIRIGKGNEGEVFYVPTWWSEVVVKKALNVAHVGKQVVQDPIDGAYTGNFFNEVLGASLLNELLEGKGEHGFLYNIQRYAGFFVCNEGQAFDLYLISEKMDGDLRQYLNQTGNLRELKVLLWQAIFTLVCLNSLEFYHQDSAIQNFLYKRVQPNETFRGAAIGRSESWVFRLEDRGWRLPNVDLVVKTADFGFLTHMKRPNLLAHQVPDYRMENRSKGFSDVSYFLVTVLDYVEKNPFALDLEELFDEWLALLGLDVKGERIETLKENEDLLPTFRFSPKHDKWDPIALLEGKFFADVVEKL